jgi:hypothetical protein
VVVLGVHVGAPSRWRSAVYGHFPGGLRLAFRRSRLVRRLYPLYHPCSTPCQRDFGHLGVARKA